MLVKQAKSRTGSDRQRSEIIRKIKQDTDQSKQRSEKGKKTECLFFVDIP
jgi:hypothetical protein